MSHLLYRYFVLVQIFFPPTSIKTEECSTRFVDSSMVAVLGFSAFELNVVRMAVNSGDSPCPGDIFFFGEGQFC